MRNPTLFCQHEVFVMHIFTMFLDCGSYLDIRFVIDPVHTILIQIQNYLAHVDNTVFRFHEYTMVLKYICVVLAKVPF